MDPAERLIWALVLLLLLSFLGLAVILAMLAAWRNYNHRQRLLDQGKRLRQEYRGESPEPADAWNEAGKRYSSDAASGGDDGGDDRDDDTDHGRADDTHRPPDR